MTGGACEPSAAAIVSDPPGYVRYAAREPSGEYATCQCDRGSADGRCTGLEPSIGTCPPSGTTSDLPSRDQTGSKSPGAMNPGGTVSSAWRVPLTSKMPIASPTHVATRVESGDQERSH